MVTPTQDRKMNANSNSIEFAQLCKVPVHISHPRQADKTGTHVPTSQAE